MKRQNTQNYIYYLIVDIWNGQGYSDSNVHLIKIKKSDEVNEQIELLNYLKNSAKILSTPELADKFLSFNSLGTKVHDALGVFETLGDDTLESRGIYNRHLTDSISFSFSDQNSWSDDSKCYEENGIITAYKWYDNRQYPSCFHDSKIMIAPMVCHHEFDDEWQENFIRLAADSIRDKDTSSESLYEDMHSNEEYENVDFILYNLKDLKKSSAKEIFGGWFK